MENHSLLAIVGFVSHIASGVTLTHTASTLSQMGHYSNSKHQTYQREGERGGGGVHMLFRPYACACAGRSTGGPAGRV